MSIYINKNNQQTGPFDDAKVLEMLGNGELSPDDSAIRQGEKEWRNLGFYFPNVGNAAPAQVAAPSAPKKSRKGLLLGCGGFLVVGLLIAGVLGFLAFRNMFPAMDDAEIPDKVSFFKLAKPFPVKGNIWGTEVSYGGEYESSPDGLTYMLWKYSGEAAAIEKFKSETCANSRNKKEGSLKDKSGNQVGEFLYCGGTLHFRNKSRVVTIYNFTILTARSNAGTSDTFIIEFVKNLPYNSELDMSGFASAYP